MYDFGLYLTFLVTSADSLPVVSSIVFKSDESSFKASCPALSIEYLLS